MRSRTALLSLLSALALTSPGKAAPITMDFTATLDRPIGGSKMVSGSFWYEPNGQGLQPGSQVGGTSGTGGSITIAGQSYEFPQWGGQPRPGDTFAAPHASFGFDANSMGNGDVFRFEGLHGVTASGASSDVTMMIWLQDSAANAFAKSSTTGLPVPKLDDFPIRQFGLWGPDGAKYDGVISSLKVHQEETPVPEPSMLIILSAGALAWPAFRVRCPRKA